MATLEEILSSPGALEQAAEEVATLSAEPVGPESDMNTGIQTAGQLSEILDGIIDSEASDYSAFCKIGRGDF